MRLFLARCLISLLVGASAALAQDAAPPVFDAGLAQRLGADDHGMRGYVFVLLKTGPNKMPDGPERDDMYRGHFANMTRLSKEGKLALAGPYDGVDGWRGLFLLAVKDIEEARKLVATSPVIIKGELVAEYHRNDGSVALMLAPRQHDKLARKKF